MAQLKIETRKNVAFRFYIKCPGINYKALNLYIRRKSCLQRKKLNSDEKIGRLMIYSKLKRSTLLANLKLSLIPSISCRQREMKE